MSAPKRFFVEKLNYPDEEYIQIQGEEFVHAKTVLRLQVGDEITLLDNSGFEYSAIVSEIKKNNMLVHIVGVEKGDKEPKQEVVLLVGLLKGDKTELVIQKAVELGISKIIVFNSQFVSAYIGDNKLDRLQKVAKEACKQCLRSVVPVVEFYDKFNDALNAVSNMENKLFACEFADKSDIDLGTIKGSTAIVVGSEGGFSKDEFEIAKSMGFNGISLGKRILRAETAAITMTSIIMFLLGELK